MNLEEKKASSDTTSKEVCCDRCGKPVGSVWVTTQDYKILCLECFAKGEGRVAS